VIGDFHSAVGNFLSIMLGICEKGQ